METTLVLTIAMYRGDKICATTTAAFPGAPMNAMTHAKYHMGTIARAMKIALTTHAMTDAVCRTDLMHASTAVGSLMDQMNVTTHARYRLATAAHASTTVEF
jgi:hypothetical protein